MNYCTYGHTGLSLSRLGFGAMRLPMDEKDGKHTIREDEAIELIRHGFERGINIIDTAWGYCYDQSQPVVGKALKGWRDKVHVSTKSPVWLIKQTSDYRRYLEEQLRIMDLEYIDIYYFHGISLPRYTETVLPLKLVEEAQKARDEGLIRHIAFSVHDVSEKIITLIDEGWAEGILCQYNLLDQKNAPALAHAKSKGLGTIVMGPVGGGRLGVNSPTLKSLTPGMATTAELALRFVLSNLNVDVALSGMSTTRQVDENADIASRDATLTDAELARIDTSLAEIKKLADLYCTGCNYCMPCPSGVKIPYNFELLNYDRVYGLGEFARHAYERLHAWKPEQRADACTECGECESKCPQNIPIRNQLKEVHATLGG